MEIEAAQSGHSLAHVAYAALKRRILTCELQPGTLINAGTVAQSLGVSPSPVHEALKQLCAEGLAEVLPKVGYRVSRLTVDDVQEIFQLRIITESHAVEVAVARASNDDLRSFADWVEWIASQPIVVGVSPSEGDSADGYASATRHNDFHLRVATLSGNRRLVQIISGLLDQSQRMIVLHDTYVPSDKPWPGLGPGHRAVADALIARDREAAINAMAGHIAHGRRHVLNALFPEPFEYNPPPNVET